MRQRQRLLNRKSAAEYLGVSERQLNRLVAFGDIPVIRMPHMKHPRYDVVDLDKLIKAWKWGPSCGV